MPGGSVLATPAWPSFAPISATTTSSATSPSDQHDHARLGLVTRFYCSTQPGGLQPAIATGRSVVAQARRAPISATVAASARYQKLAVWADDDRVRHRAARVQGDPIAARALKLLIVDGHVRLRSRGCRRRQAPCAW